MFGERVPEKNRKQPRRGESGVGGGGWSRFFGNSYEALWWFAFFIARFSHQLQEFHFDFLGTMSVTRTNVHTNFENTLCSASTTFQIAKVGVW